MPIQLHALIESVSDEVNASFENHLKTMDRLEAYAFSHKYENLSRPVHFVFSHAASSDSAYILQISMYKQDEPDLCNYCDNENCKHCCCVLVDMPGEVQTLIKVLKMIPTFVVNCKLCHNYFPNVKPNWLSEEQVKSLVNGTSVKPMTEISKDKHICRECFTQVLCEPLNFFECCICHNVMAIKRLQKMPESCEKHSDMICESCWMKCAPKCPICKTNISNSSAGDEQANED